MKEVEDKLSVFVKDQFPQHYRETGPLLISFVQAYYEFLEQENESLDVARNLLEYKDIDNSIENFLVHFKKQYINKLPFDTQSSTEFILKNSLDLYKAKGSPRAVQLLFKLVYGVESQIRFPNEEILVASSADFRKPEYIEVTDRDREYLLSTVGKEIQGSQSGAKAFAESLATKMTNGKEVHIITLTNLRGTFIRGELVSVAGKTLDGAPEITGSLSDINIQVGGKNNSVGDLFNVEADVGKQGIARVAEVINTTGTVEFTLVDGGFGFSTSNTLTQTPVSTAMLQVNNFTSTFANGDSAPQTNFEVFRTLVQPLETVTVLGAQTVSGTSSANDFFTKVVPGAKVHAYAGASTKVGNGFVVEVSNSSPAAGTIKVCVEEGTFGGQASIGFTGNTATFQVGEKVLEGSDVVLTVATSGFSSSDVIQANTSGANGTIQAITNSSSMIVNSVFGTFEASGGESIFKVSAPSTQATSTSASVSTSGANGIITAIPNSNHLTLDDVVGVFTATKKMRGQRSNTNATIANNSITGSTFVVVVGNDGGSDYNLFATQDTFANSFVTANIQGANTNDSNTYVGGTGNTGSFSNSIHSFVYSSFEVANNDNLKTTSTVNLAANVISVFTGTSAAFEVTSIEDDETVQMFTDFPSDNNVSNVQFLDVRVDSSNSGTGFVDSVVVSNNGSGYAGTDTVKFTAGGLGGANAATIATANVTVDGSGGITVSTITNHGVGYFTNAAVGTITSPGGGSGAVLTPVMDFGYGFVKDPQVGIDDPINKALTQVSGDIGTITALGRFNPGKNYNIEPFFNIYSRFIAKFDRRDIVLLLDDVYDPSANGKFVDNEFVTQTLNVQRQTLTVNASTSGAPTDISAGDNIFQITSGTANVTGTVISANSTKIVVGDVKTRNSDGTVSTDNLFIKQQSSGNNVFAVKNSTANAWVGTINDVANTTATTSSKGKVSGNVFTTVTVDLDGNTTEHSALLIRRKSFGVNIANGEVITGGTSGASAKVTGAFQANTKPIGFNANAFANTNIANGVITKFEIIDSGYGYLNDANLTLSASNNDFIVSATANVTNHGIGQGFWEDRKGFIGESKIHDNDKYQEYSYEVDTSISLDKYEQVLKDLMHVAGTKLSAIVSNISEGDMGMTVAGNVSANSVVTS